MSQQKKVSRRDSQPGQVREPHGRPAASAKAPGGGCCSRLSVHSHTQLLLVASGNEPVRARAESTNPPGLRLRVRSRVSSSLSHFLPCLLFDCLPPLCLLGRSSRHWSIAARKLSNDS